MFVVRVRSFLHKRADLNYRSSFLTLSSGAITVSVHANLNICCFDSEPCSGAMHSTNDLKVIKLSVKLTESREMCLNE